jgi:hypothetical protein
MHRVYAVFLAVGIVLFELFNLSSLPAVPSWGANSFGFV